MVLSGCGVAAGVDHLLAERAHGLGEVLVARSAASLLIAVAYDRPSPSTWRPRKPRWAAARFVSGGLTFLGWFGAVEHLGAAPTTALLLLDSFALTLVARSTQRTVPAVLCGVGILAYVARALAPVELHQAGAGLALALLAIVARAASYWIWERSVEEHESKFPLVATPLLGALVAGAAVWQDSPTAWSASDLVVMSATAVLGVVGYRLGDTVIRVYGAFGMRALLLLQVPLLALAAARTRAPDLLAIGVAVLLGVAGLALGRRERAQRAPVLTPGGTA